MFRELIQALDDLTDDEFQAVLNAYRARAQSLKALKLKPYDVDAPIRVDYANADPTLAQFYAPRQTVEGEDPCR